MINFKKFLLHNRKNIAKIIDFENLKVVLDHSLGGGAEFYFLNEIKNKNENILRIQPFSSFFILSLYTKNKMFQEIVTYKKLQNLLINLENSTIFINHLANYKNIPQVLNFVETLKSNNNEIIMFGHDYFSICPGFNLLDKNRDFCQIPDKKECQICFPKNSLINKKYGKNLSDWRKIWGDFFEKTLDELFVLSESSKSIFLKAYPILENKITVKAPSTSSFETPLSENRKTGYPETINIGIIGTITFIKGREIVSQMAELIKNEPYKNVKLTVIGEYQGKGKIQSTGKYKREDLPKLIEANKIDIIFIPSICPETYSYTTSEAISLNLPVACFNIGAPLERVSKYEKGLVITEISAQKALNEIVGFLKKLHRT